MASGTSTELEAGIRAPAWWASPLLLGHDAAAAIWSDAETPWQVVRLDARGSAPLLRVAERDRYPGAPWEEVTFSTEDGSTCQGWLLRPSGTPPWPTILHSHGGPHLVATPTFDPLSQAWVDQGYAVLTVNYRGSITFGDAWRDALVRKVGEADVADMVAAHRWLIESGIARPDLVILNGKSWGGYVTLQTMATHPGRWAAGIAEAPVTDWILSREDQSGAFDAMDRVLFGTDVDEDRESRVRASPRTYVDRFDAPVLIITPEADSRTPIRPVRAFVDDMRAAGKEIEFEVVGGGHIGLGKEQRVAIMDRSLRFADEIRRRADSAL